MVGNDLHLQIGDHVGVQAHADFKITKSADGSVEQNAATVDFHTLGQNGIANHGGGHRAVQLVVLAHMHGDNDVQGLDLLGKAASFGALGVHAGLQLLALKLEGMHVGFGSQHCKTLGEEVVAAVAGLHRNHITKNTEIFHVGAKNNFH